MPANTDSKVGWSGGSLGHSNFLGIQYVLGENTCRQNHDFDKK